MIAGSVFTILAFIGFEQAAPIAEEAREPRRTIPLAIILACLGIGLFYILNTYASAVSFGPAKMIGFTADDSNPWQNVLARDAWGGLGFLLVFLALVNSVIANQNAANNSSTRTMFAMGRIRLLPDGVRPAQPVRLSAGARWSRSWWSPWPWRCSSGSTTTRSPGSR